MDNVGLLEQKRTQLEQMLKTLETKYHQMLGALALVNELLDASKKPDSAPKETPPDTATV